MVLADKNYDDLKNGGGRRGGGGGSGAEAPNSASGTTTTLNGHISDDGSATDDSERDDIGMRVGGDYQALIPDVIANLSDRYPDCIPEKALLVWSPSPEITETKLDEFLSASKEKFGYNAEQALGMLFWHKHDLEKAMGDLPNFTPFPDEWTVEDKVLFEQAFQFHGKSFHRIRQMLPDKSIASLVKYYYSWKKTRCRTSLMDRQARKRASQREEGRSVSIPEATSKSASSSASYSIIPNTLFKTFSEVCSEDGSNSDTDIDTENERDSSGIVKTQCSNCTLMSSQCQSTSKGSLCTGCYQYWRHTGSMKVVSGPSKKLDLRDRHNTLKSKRKPPRGMHLSHDDLKAIALGPTGQGDAILKGMDSEVISLKRQVQNNKQIISALKHKTVVNIDDSRPQEGTTRMNARWTNEELLLAVQGVRKYGKDFKAIAELIGNKTETHLRTFFVNYRRRYNLDGILQEYEAENGPMSDEEKMDVDASPSNSASNSNSGTSTPVSSLLGSSAINGTNTTTNSSSNANSVAVPPPLPPPSSSSSSSSSTSVPPPLLKPVQSPSIMNRSVTRPQTQQQQTRFPGTRTAPPPLIRPNSKPIMAAMRSSSSSPSVHSQPPQLSTRE